PAWSHYISDVSSNFLFGARPLPPKDEGGFFWRRPARDTIPSPATLIRRMKASNAITINDDLQFTCPETCECHNVPAMLQRVSMRMSVQLACPSCSELHALRYGSESLAVWIFRRVRELVF